MTKRQRLIACLLLVALLTMAITACSPAMEPEYAPSPTESTLQGMSDGDYAKYTEYFIPEIRTELSEAAFQEVSQLIKSKIGNYVDKVFWKVEVSSQYTVVYYKARFSQEPADVITKAVFQEIDGKMYIAGFWLDSPKLREQ